MVMEKSWNMKHLLKVMEFCYQSWNFTKFICLFATTQEERWRNDHGKVMEKYFVKSMGTLMGEIILNDYHDHSTKQIALIQTINWLKLTPDLARSTPNRSNAFL